MSAARPGGFDHLEHMSDRRGLFEHAAGREPLAAHGYCTDDNARLLLVAARAEPTATTRRLSRLALDLVVDACAPGGRCRNRMDRSGRWTDRPANGDWWGRAVWGLGAAATSADDPVIRRRARRSFDEQVVGRSRWPRSMAFAALGAADVVAIAPDHGDARSLLHDAVRVIGPIPRHAAWSWPEPRMSYANAALAEALIAAGAALDRQPVLEQGLEMLDTLLHLETIGGHLSVTGVGGRGPGDAGPMFDQQPIEVAAMADACWRAYAVTGDRTWATGIAGAAAWFTGDNDLGLAMFDAESNGGYDGLHADRVNLNQGAESTLAFVSTMDRAHSFAHTP